MRCKHLGWNPRLGVSFCEFLSSAHKIPIQAEKLKREKMAKQKKEGRGKDLPTDIPSETQRMMIRDMHDFRITGVN